MYANLLYYSIFLYQFIFAIFFQKNTYYFIFNPYSISLILISLFFYLNHRDPVFKNFIKLYFYIFIIFFIFIIKFLLFNTKFSFSFIKNFQFVYGILILTPGLLILKKILRLHKSNFQINIEQLLKSLIFLIGSITVIEFILVIFFGFKPSDVFYLNSSFINFIDESKNSLGPFGYRPFGVLFYPQPNGLMLAFLLSLYLFFSKKIDFIFLFGTICLIISQSYSGLYFFIFSIILAGNFKHKDLVVLLLILIFIILFLFFDNYKFLYKFSFDYLKILLFREGQLISKILSLGDLNIFEFFFGVSSNFKEISHEWSYPSIIREFGLVGFLIFLSIYIKILVNLLPKTVPKRYKLIFTGLFMIINLHYPSICFLPFQILLVLIYSKNSEYLK